MTLHYATHSWGNVMLTGPGRENLTPKQARSFAIQLLRAADEADNYTERLAAERREDAQRGPTTTDALRTRYFQQ